MAEIPTWIPVVAAAIRDSAGRLLLQRALPGKAHQGLWEFPGGKVDPGETPRAALVREVNEELALRLDPAALAPAGFAEGASGPGGATVVLFFYSAGAFSGDPAPLDGQEWGWFAPAEAAALPLAPLDRALFERLGG